MDADGGPAYGRCRHRLLELPDAIATRGFDQNGGLVYGAECLMSEKDHGTTTTPVQTALRYSVSRPLVTPSSVAPPQLGLTSMLFALPPWRPRCHARWPTRWPRSIGRSPSGVATLTTARLSRATCAGSRRRRASPSFFTTLVRPSPAIGWRCPPLVLASPAACFLLSLGSARLPRASGSFLGRFPR